MSYSSSGRFSGPGKLIDGLAVLFRLASLLSVIGCARIEATELPAFPDAVGQGARASGGRGGDVYHVTSLADYRPKSEEKINGTLRHAIRSAEGPRTIVFDVGGPIALKEPLEILKSKLTIAGQTAPKPGITLWGYPVEISRGSDVIVRYLRVRLGDFHVQTEGTDKPHPFQGNGDLDPTNGNAFSIGGGCERVIVDHLSTSWGIDETLSVTSCRDVTVQHCIIAASLNDSFHPKGKHGYGTLIRGELTAADQAAGAGGFTFFGNLWAHHRARSPSIGGQQNLDSGQPEDQRRQTDLNLVNNVVYNWKDQPTHRSGKGAVRVNFIGNYYINGPEKDAVRIFKEGDPARTEVYHAGNAMDYDQDAQHNGFAIATERHIARAFRDFSDDDSLVSEDSGEPFSFLGEVTKHVSSAEISYNRVISLAGCSIWRDAIDEAIIESVVHRRGSLIDSQEQLRSDEGVLQGIDNLPIAKRPQEFDTDGDGMPDDFEVLHHLDPKNPSDRNGTDLSKQQYTNLEVYLHQLTLNESSGP